MLHTMMRHSSYMYVLYMEPPYIYICVYIYINGLETYIYIYIWVLYCVAQEDKTLYSYVESCIFINEEYYIYILEIYIYIRVKHFKLRIIMQK